VVQGKERAQVAELVGAAQCLGVRVAQLDAVARGEFKGELGLERAFDLQVQLGLGQRADLGAGHGPGMGRSGLE